MLSSPLNERSSENEMDWIRKPMQFSLSLFSLIERDDEKYYFTT